MYGVRPCVFVFLVFVFVYEDLCIFVFAYQRGFQRGIPDVKVRRSRSGLAGTRGLQASHLAKKTINNGASGALVHRSSGAPLLWCIGTLLLRCIGAPLFWWIGAPLH
jgi:hypothetical protein